MDSSSLDVNVSAYVKAFRIFYNELKAMNASELLITGTILGVELE